MTYAKFMEAVTSFYGNYRNEFIEDIVIKYIKTTFEEHDLPDIFASLVKRYTNQYKTPPDVAVFEEIFKKDNIEAEAMDAYNEVNNNICSYRDIMFEDIRVQAVIESMGGWIAYCQRDPNYESLHRKEFIKLFKLYTNNPPSIRHRILRGLLDKNECIFIGNRNECLKLLEHNPASEMPGINKMLNDVVESSKMPEDL